MDLVLYSERLALTPFDASDVDLAIEIGYLPRQRFPGRLKRLEKQRLRLFVVVEVPACEGQHVPRDRDLGVPLTQPVDSHL